MLDIKFIRENTALVKQTAKNKGIKLDIDDLLKLDKNKRELQNQLDQLREQRNDLAKAAKQGRPDAKIIEQGKRIKSKINNLEEKFNKISDAYSELLWLTPAIPAADAPVGQDESGNIEIRQWGQPPKFNFKAKSHLDLGQALDLLDIERGAKVSGFRGYYLKNQGAQLQLALIMFAWEKMIKYGYTPMLPPTIVNDFALYGSGHFPFGREEIYQVANPGKLADGSSEKQNKYLVGTSEPSVLAYHADEILREQDLPKKYCAFSQCYRSEAGSYGKDTKGLYRLHEFMKIEQVIIAQGDYQISEKLHQEITAVSEEILKELNIPYRVLEICSGDMGAGKYRMYDLESWMPSRQAYGETHSSSNLGDWQARRLNIKYRSADGKKYYVHTLNNTALASPRLLIAILENNQQADGSIMVPQVLRKFLPNNIQTITK